MWATESQALCQVRTPQSTARGLPCPSANICAIVQAQLDTLLTLSRSEAATQAALADSVLPTTHVRGKMPSSLESVLDEAVQVTGLGNAPLPNMLCDGAGSSTKHSCGHRAAASCQQPMCGGLSCQLNKPLLSWTPCQGDRQTTGLAHIILKMSKCVCH